MACLYWTNFIKNEEKKLLFWLLNILSMNMHTSFESAHLHTWYFSLHTRDLGEKGHTLQSGCQLSDSDDCQIIKHSILNNTTRLNVLYMCYCVQTIQSVFNKYTGTQYKFEISIKCETKTWNNLQHSSMRLHV
jgi:hypothetical protein